MTVRAICLTLPLWCSTVTGEGPPPDPGRIEQLIQRMNVSWDLDAQVDAKAAYDELCKLGRVAVPAFLRAIEQGNGSARMWSAAALASTRDPRAVTPMLGLLKDGHTKVRMVATYHIHVFLPRDPRVAPALGKQMADQATAVRQQAMKVLQKGRPATALPEIRDALRSEDLRVRADALRMVLAYEKKQPHVEIPKLIHDGEGGHVRSAAVAILPTVAKLDPERAREIVGLVSDPEPLLVGAALSVLRDFFKEPSLSGNELRAIFEAASVAIPNAAKRPEPGVRAEALPLLGHLKREGSLTQLVEALRKDASAPVRAAAARGLVQTKLTDMRILAPLLEATRDAEPEVRATALKLLAALNKKGSLSIENLSLVCDDLLSRVDVIAADPDASVRAAAYVALAELLKSKTADVLMRAAQTERDPKARKAAVLALYMTGRQDAPVVAAVVSAIADADTEVNSTAAKIVRKLLSSAPEGSNVGAAAAARLRQLAASRNPVVRARSLPVLGMVEGKDSLELIANAIRTDPDASVRKAALEALIRTRARSVTAVGAAISGLKDETALVRTSAYRVFQYLTRASLRFNPTGEPEARKRALVEIEKWWAEHAAEFGEAE